MFGQCVICGAPLRRNARQFCSISCRSEGRKRATLASRPKCRSCGNPVRLPTYKFCSHACAGKARKARGECPVCGTEVIPPRKYCSNRCAHVGNGHQWKREYTCYRCGKTFERYPSSVRNPERVYCSGECRSAGRVYKRGSDHPQYKAGGYRYVNADGYVVLGNGRQVKTEHRAVMEQVLGRALAEDETVHHINGDRSDNRPENLQLRQGRHGRGARFMCGDCGSHNVVPVRLPETHHVNLTASLEHVSELK